MQLHAMLLREAHAGENVMLGLVHQRRELGPSLSELTSDMAPCLAGLLAVWLLEGLTHGGGGDRVLSLRDMRHGVAHPVDAGAVEEVRLI
jgi:hypothetical protein